MGVLWCGELERTSGDVEDDPVLGFAVLHGLEEGNALSASWSASCEARSLLADNVCKLEHCEMPT